LGIPTAGLFELAVVSNVYANPLSRFDQGTAKFVKSTSVEEALKTVNHTAMPSLCLVPDERSS
jgi:hypothetical protein